jgi:hypothetical protein
LRRGGQIAAIRESPQVGAEAGDIRVYKEWQTPDERVKLSDLVIAARAIAYAMHRLCG